MRRLYFDDQLNKRVRGQRRQCKEMVRDIIEDTRVFPIKYATESYWHYRVPISRLLVESRHTPRSIKRLCWQTLIDRAYFLSQDEPVDCRVMSILTWPEIWDSVIEIFFDEGYYQSFFDRQGPWQKWTPICDRRNIVQEYHLSVPDNFYVKGYKEENFDDYDPSILTYTSELWVIGEI
jgi:hypothetical protein